MLCDKNFKTLFKNIVRKNPQVPVCLWFLQEYSRVVLLKLYCPVWVAQFGWYIQYIAAPIK